MHHLHKIAAAAKRPSDRYPYRIINPVQSPLERCRSRDRQERRANRRQPRLPANPSLVIPVARSACGRSCSYIRSCSCAGTRDARAVSRRFAQLRTRGTDEKGLACQRGGRGGGVGWGEIQKFPRVESPRARSRLSHFLPLLPSSPSFSPFSRSSFLPHAPMMVAWACFVRG